MSLFGILDQWKLSFFHPLIQGHSASDRHFLSNFGIMLLFPVFSHLYLTEYKESLSGKKEENQQRRNQYLKNGEMEIEWKDKLEQNQSAIPFGIPCTGLRSPISGSHDVIKIKFQDTDLLEFLLS